MDWPVERVILAWTTVGVYVTVIMSGIVVFTTVFKIDPSTTSSVNQFDLPVVGAVDVWAYWL